jgi:tetratricopeptide (TPR) repeat protein
MATCYYCLGKHESSQCTALATRKITAAQEATSVAIVQATERASRDLSASIESAGYATLGHLSEMTWELESIHEALTDLQEFLNWGISEVLWRQEKQIELLTGIHDMLKNPRATQANELFKMGMDSFKRRQHADALRLLKEARELNPGDYRVLVTLGHTFVRMNDLSNAVEAFQAGIAYARSTQYKKGVLLLASRALRALERLEEAIGHAREAVKLDDRYAPAQYELAGCLAEQIKALASPKKTAL